MKGRDAFERSVKEAMQHFEVPYNSADWQQLERAMDSAAGRRWTLNTGLMALLITGVLGLVIGTALLVQNADAPAPQRVESDLAMNNLSSLDAPQAGPEAEAVSATTATQEQATGEGAAADGLEPETATSTATSRTRDDRNEAATESAKSAGKADKPALSTASPVAGTTDALRSTVGKDAAPVKKTSTPDGSLSIMASVSEGCPGTTIEFNVQDLPDDGIFLWNFGDGSFSNKPNPSHTFSKPGKFEVMLSHSSTSGGSIMSKPSSDLIVIHEAPQAAFNPRKQEYEGLIPSVHFENRSGGTGNTYLWDFGDGHTSTVAHPDHVFKRKGEYRVELTVTNSKGCVDKTDRLVRIERDYNLEAATAFSPNGDGVNDYFIPEALTTLGLRFHMSIHDPATGEVLYETTDPQRPWNGRVNNKGEKCDVGEYVWVVEMKDGDRFGGSYTGKVKLER